MSINFIITVGIIALMFAWVPFLKLICPIGWSGREVVPGKDEG